MIQKKIKNQRLQLFREIYVNQNADESKKQYEQKRFKVLLLLGTSFLLLSGLVYWKEQESSLFQDGFRLQRPKPGEGNKSIPLEYTIGDFKFQRNILISEQQYKGEEKEALFDSGIQYLEKALLGSNISYDVIQSDFSLFHSIPNTGIKVSWSFSPASLVSYQGKVDWQQLSSEGTFVSITATLDYFGEIRTHKMYAKLFPPDSTEKEVLSKQMEETLKTADQESVTKEYLDLPLNLQDQKIIYSNTEESWSQFCILGILSCCAIWFAMEQDLKKKRKYRKYQLLLDYPELINKYSLLLGAGMTTKAAWNRIVDDYSKQKKHFKGAEKKMRYVYEEMLITKHEIALGRSESICYEAFGKRCALLPYIRFSTILVQNLKKGTSGIITMLELEATEAFAERKELAKRLGEEAGTKLLAPMAGMLLIVLLMVLVPAFLSFGLT